LHIPKTAGTSVVDQAVVHYGEQNVCSHGDYLGKTPSELAEVPFVSGHFGYDFASRLMGSRYSFTFLRNPAERLLSFYFFCRTRDPEEFEVYRLAQQLDLDSFLGRAFEVPLSKAYLWNNQAWQLAHGYGKLDGRSIVGFDPEEILELAKNHLPEFDYVGFTETFDRDRETIFRHLGIRSADRPWRSNVLGARPMVEDLPASTRRLLERLTELDRELYEHAWSRSFHSSSGY
jgi:hypothetical protein